MKISIDKIYIWTYILSVKLYENRRNFKMQCPLLLNHISFWILKNIFVPHTRTLENWVIFYLHSSQNDFFLFWRNCSSVYQFYCPFCYNFKTEFRVTAKSKPFFFLNGKSFRIRLYCKCVTMEVSLPQNYFSRKVLTKCLPILFTFHPV